MNLDEKNEEMIINEVNVQSNENELISSKESFIEQINENLSLNQTKKMKRNRRRRICSYSQKKRKKSLNKEQFWMNKYSIESFSIRLYRCQLPE